MFTGRIIKESLADANVLHDLRVVKEETWNIDNAALGQPSVWHVVTVEVEPERMDAVAERISRALAEGKWFVDFTDGETIVVVFRERIFKYQKGDATGREEAQVFGRSLGIPESQLGWEK